MPPPHFQLRHDAAYRRHAALRASFVSPLPLRGDWRRRYAVRHAIITALLYHMYGQCRINGDAMPF